MITSIAFTLYPVKDVALSRRFYEGILGLKLTHEFGGQWIEYDLGDATFAIATADAEHPAPVRGVAVAFEVNDLDAEVARLKSKHVKIEGEIVETPVCRFVKILDPDGSEVLLHQRRKS